MNGTAMQSLSSGFKKRKRTGWIEDAACIGTSPRRFDVAPRTSRLLVADPSKWIDTIRTQAPMCEHCPVAMQCARDALDTNDQEIIRGGVAVPRFANTMTRAHFHAARMLQRDVANGVPLPVVYDMAPAFIERWANDV